MRALYSASIFLNAACNSHCKYCYRHSDKGEMPFAKAREIVGHLSRMGFRKVSFAGGEPTIMSWDVFRLVKEAKEAGMVTELITNGLALAPQSLPHYKEILDILTVDVDSPNPLTLGKLGRHPNQFEVAKNLHLFCRLSGITAKLNSVATAWNLPDIVELADYVLESPVLRWKVFQFLPSYGPAKKWENELKVSAQQFEELRKKLWHKMRNWYPDLENHLILESNAQMCNNYASIDPLGNFYVSQQQGQKVETSLLGEVLQMDMEGFLDHPLINRGEFQRRCEWNGSLYETKGE
ncbi:MAG TPA: radical SAM protein [Thermotogota bacterium]|nr:radical SAM protein [Thermotogota bacterium]